MPTPSQVTHRLIVGTTVRKHPTILAAYLASLEAQEWPRQVEPFFAFVSDTDDPEANALLDDFTVRHPGIVFRPGAGPQDTDDSDPVTHRWSPSGMARVGRYKNLLLQYTVSQKAWGIWFVDADLICDPTTIASLWSHRAPIACAVYWTHWHNPATAAGTLHAAPQVWLSHPYGLEGHGMDAAEFRHRLVKKERTQVWGQGACTLIRADAIQKGVSFDYVPGVSTEGMMAGEDRHFCLRATALHLPMLADPWPDIFHIYHPQDRDLIPTMQARLGTPHPQTPRVGDWVNLVIEPMEPVPIGPGQLAHQPPAFFRGRIGAGRLLPELEERVASMTRGTTTVLGVHYPIHYPVPFLRGQRRLMRVTLVDCKPDGYPPVLEQELLRGVTSGSVADRVTLSREQQMALQADEVAV